MYVLQRIPRPCLKKNNIGPTALPTIAGNASIAFPASLLSELASLSSHSFKTPPSSLGVETEPPVPSFPPKTPVTGSTIVEICH